MSLDQLIAPEVKDDGFNRHVAVLAQQEKLRHVLEIGSSAGAGSTEAFVTGLQRNPHQPKLYCLELSKTRCRELVDRYTALGFVRAFNASSVPTSSFKTEAEVRAFYTANTSKLNRYSLNEVLACLEQNIREANDAGVQSNGIEIIKAENSINEFDLVLIDGSAFTGMADLRAIYGSKIIMLADINDIKCLEAFETLRRDTQYVLEHLDSEARNGYAVFRKRPLPAEKTLPIHFFTIVVNGEPFIRHHIEAFNQLSVPWTWHIVEGIASLSHDSAWSVSHGGRVPEELHEGGRSIDGTSEYLDALAVQYPRNVRIYRKPRGEFWDGKVEMVNAPLSSISEHSLLVQVDCDELWTVEQLTILHRAFCENEQKTAAFFFCKYFVGPDKVISTRNTYGNNSSYEWLRAWRFFPDCRWAAHEPPKLHAPISEGGSVDLALVNPFTHQETESMGLVFDHYAYVTEEQVRFKESYYGYREAQASWTTLQNAASLPCRLSLFLPWVKDEAQVTSTALLGINPLARKGLDGRWHFRPNQPSSGLPREVVLVRTDLIRDEVLLLSCLRELRKHYPASRITMVCPEVVAPIWENNPYLDRIVAFNKDAAITNEDELEKLIEAVARLQPGVIINLMWSPDILCHLVCLSIPANVRIALRGNFADITPDAQSKALFHYNVIAEPTSETTEEVERYRDLLRALGRQTEDLRVSFTSNEKFEALSLCGKIAMEGAPSRGQRPRPFL